MHFFFLEQLLMLSKGFIHEPACLPLTQKHSCCQVIVMLIVGGEPTPFKPVSCSTENSARTCRSEKTDCKQRKTCLRDAKFRSRLSHSITICARYKVYRIVPVVRLQLACSRSPNRPVAWYTLMSFLKLVYKSVFREPPTS